MLFKRFRNKRPAKSGAMGPSIVTSEVVIDGSLVTGGELQVDGAINGDTRAQSIVVGEHGSIHGEVIAEDLILHGRVIGPVRAVRVHVYTGAHLEGDVICEAISIDDDAYVNGKITRSEDPMNEEVAGLHSAYQDYGAGDYQTGSAFGYGGGYDDPYGQHRPAPLAPRKPDAAE